MEIFLLFITRKCSALQKQQLFQRLTAVLLPEVPSDDPDDAGLDFGGGTDEHSTVHSAPMLT